MTANATNGFLLRNGEWHNHFQLNPLSIVVVNLMPTKEATERQFLTQFNQLDHDVEITFVYPATHHFKGTPFSVISRVYQSLVEIEGQTFDGVIITGAPVEKLPFQQVDYWEEFQTICDWAERHAHQTLLECWAAQAGLYHDFAITKHPVSHKIFGIYQADQIAPELANDFGAGGLLKMPQSRHTNSDIDPLRLPGDLQIVASNNQIGPLILKSHQHHRTYITGHPEYEVDTLAGEYYRDRKKRLPIRQPLHYFNSNGKINFSWKTSSNIIYQNWLHAFALQKVGN